MLVLSRGRDETVIMSLEDFPAHIKQLLSKERERRRLSGNSNPVTADEVIELSKPLFKVLIETTVTDIRGDKARLGITAPTTVLIHREEVYKAIQRENGEAENAKRRNAKPSNGEDGRPRELTPNQVHNLNSLASMN